MWMMGIFRLEGGCVGAGNVRVMIKISGGVVEFSLGEWGGD